MKNDPKRIAIFRLGHLGDTIIALPALWTVRKRFPAAHILYLTQKHQAGKRVQGLEVLREGTVFDEELAYTLGTDGVSKLQILKTLLLLRLKRIDTLVYIPPYRTPIQLQRDRRFFRLAGIKRFIGMDGYLETEYRPSGVPLPEVRREADLLLNHLAKDGVAIDEDPTTLMHMGLSDDERKMAEDWVQQNDIDTSRPVVAIGPGSKMEAKLWPVERFIEVARAVEREFNPTFLLFGSNEERAICQHIADRFPMAINLAGALTVRESAALFEYCNLYIGNDTGTMHIAAAAGAKCVAVFSARDWRGRWYPYGPGHSVHRSFVPCEGCMLETCDKDKLCLTNIRVEQVAESALRILRETSRCPVH